VPPPRLRGRTSTRRAVMIANVGGRGPAVSSRPRRSALPSRHPIDPASHDLPGDLCVRHCHDDRPLWVPRAVGPPPRARLDVHPSALCRDDLRRRAGIACGACSGSCSFRFSVCFRSGSPSALGLVRLFLFPDHASTRRDGWRERRSRGGGPEGRGTQGGTASGCGVHRVSPDAGTEQDPWVATPTGRPTRRDASAGPRPPTFAFIPSSLPRYVHEGEGVARDGVPRARPAAVGGTRADQWCHPGGW
jgi:hypothetical protein